MAKNLNMKSEILESYLSESTGYVRVYRYPHNNNNSNVNNANATLGFQAHTDNSLLTILSQDDEVNGLEVLKDDQWLIVKPISNTLIVNLGDLVKVCIKKKMIYSLLLIILMPILEREFSNPC